MLIFSATAISGASAVKEPHRRRSFKTRLMVLVALAVVLPFVVRGPVAQAAGFSRDGLPDLGVKVAIFLTVIEFAGGIAITLGLFTRLFAAAVAIEMGFLVWPHYWDNGFSWLNRGYEYVLLWGLASLAIALRGGGPYSLDRKLGLEL